MQRFRSIITTLNCHYIPQDRHVDPNLCGLVTRRQLKFEGQVYQRQQLMHISIQQLRHCPEGQPSSRGVFSTVTAMQASPANATALYHLYVDVMSVVKMSLS